MGRLRCCRRRAPSRWISLVIILAVSVMTWYRIDQSVAELGIQIQIQSMEFVAHMPLLLGEKCQPVGTKAAGIHTPGCTIPDLDPCDESVRRYIRPYSSFHCWGEDLPELTAVNGSHVVLNVSAARERMISVSRCRIWPLLPDWSSDKYRYGTAQDFREGVSVAAPFARVYCYDEADRHVYTNFHFFPQPDIDKIPAGRTDSPPNVVIMGMDSLSRLNLIRQMPRTRRLLEVALGATGLQGYHKLAGRTFSNVVPMLSGSFINDEAGAFSDAPVDINLIWKEFKKAGYATVFGEDGPDMGMFNYYKRGFDKQPTDFYFRPMSLAMYEELGWYPFYSKFCAGPKPESWWPLKWHETIMRGLKARGVPFFAFGWLSRFQHNYVNDPGMMDELYSAVFEAWWRQGLLDNTVFIVLSDHGVTYGPFRRTDIGEVEERLPFLYLRLPPSLKTNFPTLQDALNVNTQRLATPYDVYATLQHVLAFPNLAEVSSPISEGQSLFSPISPDRTCGDAGISDKWCVCRNMTSLPLSDARTLRGARFGVKVINNMLSGVRDVCHELSLRRVHKAELYEASGYVFDVQLVLETDPGGAVFQMLVRKDRDVYSVVGEIERLNKYGTQSHCIDRYNLKAYCYCK